MHNMDPLLIDAIETGVLDDFTEPESRYRSVNIDVIYLYDRLPSKADGVVARILWRSVLCSKMRGPKACKKPHEDRRIYNDITITMDYLLEEYHLSVKKSDARNMQRRLKYLHDNNVYYVWNYKGKYIVFLERFIGSWLCLNSLGCVTPKMLKKLLFLHRPIINHMCLMHKEDGNEASLEDVEGAFVGFINEIISKMNPITSCKINPWDGHKSPSCYILELMDYLDKSKISNYEGVGEADDFIDKLPPSVRQDLQKHREKQVKTMKQEQVKDSLMDIVPSGDDKNVKTPKKRKARRRKPKEADPNAVAKEQGWGDDGIDPFKNGNTFMRYARSYMKEVMSTIDPSIKLNFYNYQFESNDALRLLDEMRENQRASKFFLDSWLDYFVKNHLKGKKGIRKDNTSVKKLAETFEEYNKSFYIHQ